MTELSDAELAARSGATPDVIERLVKLGILSRSDDERAFGSGDIQRVRLVRALEESGLSLEDVGQAIADGHVSFAFVDSLFAEPVSLSTITYADLARSLGMTIEELDRLQSALGLPKTLPEDPVPEDDVAIARLWSAATATMEPDAVMRITRVYGESLQRIADAEHRFVQSEIVEPMVRSGRSAQETVEAAAGIGAGLQQIADQLVLLLHRRLMHRHTLQTFVAGLERAMAEAGVVPVRPEHPPAIAFLDLSGFTRLTEEQGDEAAAKLAQGFAEFVQETPRSYGGRLVKLLGDGAMFHFHEPLGAVLCALDLVDRIPTLGLPAARVGLHAGQVISQDGDYFGTTVNIAARVADYARPAEVLVTSDVMAAAGSDDLSYQEIGPVPLKGVADPVTLHVATRGV